jgi:hypothetical protein
VVSVTSPVPEPFAAERPIRVAGEAIDAEFSRGARWKPLAPARRSR